MHSRSIETYILVCATDSVFSTLSAYIHHTTYIFTYYICGAFNGSQTHARLRNRLRHLRSIKIYILIPRVEHLKVHEITSRYATYSVFSAFVVNKNERHMSQMRILCIINRIQMP